MICMYIGCTTFGSFVDDFSTPRANLATLCVLMTVLMELHAFTHQKNMISFLGGIDLYTVLGSVFGSERLPKSILGTTMSGQKGNKTQIPSNAGERSREPTMRPTTPQNNPKLYFDRFP